EAGERPEPLAGCLPQALGPGAGPAGDGGQADIDGAEVAPVQTLGVELLEERPVGVVEDHAQANHAGTQALGCRGRGLPHATLIAAAHRSETGRVASEVEGATRDRFPAFSRSSLDLRLHSRAERLTSQLLLVPPSRRWALLAP